MLKRTLSSLGLWLMGLLIPAYFGAQGGVWLLSILAVLTQYELYTLLEQTGFKPQRQLGCVLGAFIMLGAWYMPLTSELSTFNVGIDVFTISIIIVCLTILRHPSFTQAKRHIMPTLFGLLLVPYTLHYYIHLVKHFHSIELPLTGLLLTVWLIAVAKFSDVGGLILGSFLGRHKLAPDISPDKTWEGAVGGILTACIVGAGLAYCFGEKVYMPPTFTPLAASLIAIPIAILAIASDLVESVIKRQSGVKDSGTMIPGIGGAFDLTDSLLLTCPFGFLIFKYLLF